MVTRHFGTLILSVFLSAGLFSCTLQSEMPMGAMVKGNITVEVNQKPLLVSAMSSARVTISGENIRPDVQILIGGVNVPSEEIISSFRKTDKGAQIVVSLPKNLAKNPGFLDVILTNPATSFPTQVAESSVTIPNAIEIKAQ